MDDGTAARYKMLKLMESELKGFKETMDGWDEGGKKDSALLVVSLELGLVADRFSSLGVYDELKSIYRAIDMMITLEETMGKKESMMSRASMKELRIKLHQLITSVESYEHVALKNALNAYSKLTFEMRRVGLVKENKKEDKEKKNDE